MWAGLVMMAPKRNTLHLLSDFQAVDTGSEKRLGAFLTKRWRGGDLLQAEYFCKLLCLLGYWERPLVPGAFCQMRRARARGFVSGPQTVCGLHRRISTRMGVLHRRTFRQHGSGRAVIQKGIGMRVVRAS